MAYQDAFTALADPTRRHIFESLLDSPKTVGEIAANETVSRPAVSQHLRILESAQLLEVELRGNRRVYSIKQGGLVDLRQYLNRFCSDVLPA
jgi:DNA-binding transcriptional ArsR family regulator